MSAELTQKEIRSSLNRLYCYLEGHSEWRKSLQIAIDVYDKSIPKTPIDYSGKYKCGNCWREVNEHELYCQHCGQKIDWLHN